MISNRIVHWHSTLFRHSYTARAEGVLNEASDIVKGAGAVAKFLQPLSDLVGPAFAEIGEMFGDTTRHWRANNAARLLEKTQAKLTIVGGPIKPVAPRNLIPLLEAASLEDDDTLQELWASLLATASSRPNDFTAAFIATMRLLSPADAQFIQALHGKTFIKENFFIDWDEFGAARLLGITEESAHASLESLERVGVVKLHTRVTSLAQMVTERKSSGDAAVNVPRSSVQDLVLRNDGYFITRYGELFIRACIGLSALDHEGDRTISETQEQWNRIQKIGADDES